MNNCNIFILKQTLEDNGFIELTKNIQNQINQSNLNIIWYSSCINKEVYQQLLSYQKINHFPKSYEICRKDLMHLNLDKMKSKFGVQYCFFPKTYIIPNDIQQMREEFEKHQHQGSYWIVKPSNSSQGKGIYLIDNFQELITKKYSQKLIASHYISNPLLINKLKFDLRIYVLMTGVNPLKVYRYSEGLVRLATQEFSLRDINKFTHLTNYSINKNNPNFIQNTHVDFDSIGSKQSFSALLHSLSLQGINTDFIIRQIDDLIIKTILSAENHLFAAFNSQVPYQNNCFELFGFDVLLDDQYKAWLLEVNMCPSLATDSPLDHKVKGNLLADCFSLIGILPYDQRNSNNIYFNHNGQDYNNSQNYNQNNHILPNLANNHYNSALPKILFLQNLNKQQKQIILLAEEELLRKKQFNRIFPTPDSIKYKQLFISQRPNNQILINWEIEKLNLIKNNQINKNQNFEDQLIK